MSEFCTRPWQEIHINKARKIKPCNWYVGGDEDLLDFFDQVERAGPLNIDNLKTLRRDFLQRKTPHGCSVCAKLIELGNESPRICENEETISLLRATARSGKVINSPTILSLVFESNKSPPPLENLLKYFVSSETRVKVLLGDEQDEKNFIGWILSSKSHQEFLKKATLEIKTRNSFVGNMVVDKLPNSKIQRNPFPSLRELLEQEELYEIALYLAYEENSVDKVDNIIMSIDLSPIPPAMAYELGDFCYQHKKYLSMFKLFKHYISLQEKDKNKYIQIAWMLKEADFLDTSFEILEANSLLYDSKTKDFIFCPGWEGLSSSNRNKLINIYKSHPSRETNLKLKESLAYLLKLREETEESFDLHMELLSEDEVSDEVLASLVSGGWENLKKDQIEILIKELVFIQKKESINPEISRLALRSLAFLTKKLNLMLDSLSWHLQALEEGPEDEEIILSLVSGGWNKLPLEEIPVIIREYKKIEKRERLPDEIRSKLEISLAFLLKQEGSLSESLYWHQKVLERNPRSSEVLESLLLGGWQDLENTEIHKLLNIFDEFHSIFEFSNKTEMKFKEAKAYLLKKIGEYEKSFDLHKEILEKDANNQRILDSLVLGGWSELTGARKSLYVEIVDKSLHFFSESTKIKVDLGILLKDDAIFRDKAISYLQEGCDEECVSDPDVYSSLAKLFFEQGDEKNALKYQKLALTKSNKPNYEKLKFVTGILNRNEKLKEANIYLNEVLNCKEATVEDYKVLGWNYKKIGQYYKSVQIFKKALHRYPGDKECQEEIHRMSGTPMKKLKMTLGRILK